MSELGDTLSMAIEALEEFAPSVRGLTVAPRIQIVVQALYELQFELDQLEN